MNPTHQRQQVDTACGCGSGCAASPAVAREVLVVADAFLGGAVVVVIAGDADLNGGVDIGFRQAGTSHFLPAIGHSGLNGRTPAQHQLHM